MHLFVENLTVIDCSYLDAERGIVGESWIVDLALGGLPDDQGMMMDFAHVKKRLKQVIDETIDHTLVIPGRLPGLELAANGASFTFTNATGHRIEHDSPADAVTVLDTDAVTPDSVRDFLLPHLRANVPGNVTDIRLELRMETIDGAYYHYSHGLKKHDGNCQRIAHGHRSKLHIWQDGTRSPALEQEWAERFRDIYIGTREDISRQFSEGSTDYLEFAYTAQQGAFRLVLPASSCHLIETDSTVEYISDHLCRELAASHPGHAFRVRAYEGVGKGAESVSAANQEKD